MSFSLHHSNSPLFTHPRLQPILRRHSATVEGQSSLFTAYTPPCHAPSPSTHSLSFQSSPHSPPWFIAAVDACSAAPSHAGAERTVPFWGFGALCFNFNPSINIKIWMACCFKYHLLLLLHFHSVWRFAWSCYNNSTNTDPLNGRVVLIDCTSIIMFMLMYTLFFSYEGVGRHDRAGGEWTGTGDGENRTFGFLKYYKILNLLNC